MEEKQTYGVPHSDGFFGVEGQFQHHDLNRVGDAQGVEVHALRGRAAGGFHCLLRAFLGEGSNDCPYGWKFHFFVVIS